MLSLEKISNPRLILDFITGEGVRKRVGFKSLEHAMEVVDSPDNVFLLAKENGVDKGFVCLFPVHQRGFALHLCLRTIGDKTKEFVRLSIEYAKSFLDAVTIYAVYPTGARAVERLCRYFNFTPHPDVASALSEREKVKYNFETLSLA